jgi:hypothetical protein
MKRLKKSFSLGVFLYGCVWGGCYAQSSPDELLCSPRGIAQLVPQFKVDQYGQLIVPDPTKDPQGFLDAQQGLSNIITATLARQNANLQSPEVLAHPNQALQFGSNWRAAEFGVQSEGDRVVSIHGDQFGSYGGDSFLSGLEPVSLPTNGGVKTPYYAAKKVVNKKVQFPALVYPIPTVNPCINSLILGARDTTGIWPQPTYALGKFRPDSQGNPDRTQPLDAYLIVNICLDLGHQKRTAVGEVLTPNAEIITAMQWACEMDSPSEYCKKTGKAHQH